MSKTNGARRRYEVESWFALLGRIVAFWLGVAILVGQGFFFQPYLPLIIVGVGCLGPTVAKTIAQASVATKGAVAALSEEKE